MKKMFWFIIIGLFLLACPSVLANDGRSALSQDYLDIAQDYFSQGDYQNSYEYVDFALQLSPENQQAIDLKNKIDVIAKTPIDAKQEPKTEPAPVAITELNQNQTSVPEVNTETHSKIEVTQPIQSEIKSEVQVEPTIKSGVNQEQVIIPEDNQVQPPVPTIDPVGHVCPVDLNPAQTAEIVNSQIETPAEIEQFLILELPRANISDMEYPKYTKFQKNLLNFIDDLIISHPNKKSLYYAKLKIYKYKNDDMRYDELSEFIIKKFEQVK